MSTDRIEKHTLLKAPLDRVWRAISDSAQFGTWFGMSIDGPFVAGTTVTGVITPTAVDDAVAERQRPHAGAPVPLQIVAVEPRRRLAFRWNPVPGPEFAKLTTLVEFTLTETDDGVLLDIVESGFDAIPEGSRASAFENNSEGWSIQAELVAKYLALGERV
jgi:uncharacterized protein YndB with AHSA1/START domain